MRSLALYVVALALAGCGLFRKDNEHEPTTSPTQELGARADAYCALEDAAADAHGWVGADCDLALFNALRAVGCPASSVALEVAEDPATPGEWHRDSARACYREARTKARFSRDMLVGVLVWAWDVGPERGLIVVERLITYVETHGGFVCEAVDAGVREARCRVRDNLLATMYELRFRHGGGDSPKRQGLQFFDPGAVGSERHVQAWHLYLRGLMFGAVTDPELVVLEEYGKASPLFAAMARKFQTGDLEAVTSDVVGDSVRFPAGALPTSSGRCTAYLWERDVGDDWYPCPTTNDDGTPRAPETYPGVDLVAFRAVVADLLPVGSDPTSGLIGGDAPPRVHVYRRLGT